MTFSATHIGLRRCWRGLALSCLALMLAACGGDDKAPAGGAGGQGGGDRPTPVTTIRLQPETFAERISAIGTVKARESVTVTAKVSELVQQVHFDSGDEVRAGAPLITLSDRQQHRQAPCRRHRRPRASAQGTTARDRASIAGG